VTVPVKLNLNLKPESEAGPVHTTDPASGNAPGGISCELELSLKVCGRRGYDIVQ